MGRFWQIVFFVLLGGTAARAQEPLGAAHSDSRPAGGVFANPAHIAGYRYKADINILSAGGLLFSDAAAPDSLACGNVDLLLPSFIYVLDKNQSFGLTTRARTLFGETAAMDTSVYFRGWADIGLSYATTVFQNYRHRLSAGITLKAYTGTDLFSGHANLFDLRLQYGYGMDVGAVYEWKKKDPEQYESKYIVRAGVAVSDISRLYNGTAVHPAPLPVYLRTTVDYNFHPGFYAHLSADINLKKDATPGYGDVYTLSPRWESAPVGVSSPISYYPAAERIHWGLSLHFGIFFIGSGSVFSHLIAWDVASADVHFGVHIPLGDTWQPAPAVKTPPVMERPSY